MSQTQTDVRYVNQAEGIVIFDDGEIGTITNWIDDNGDVHTTNIECAVSVVAKHPGRVPHPWYAIALGEFEPLVL